MKKIDEAKDSHLKQNEMKKIVEAKDFILIH
jgi:hypothetical protein